MEEWELKAYLKAGDIARRVKEEALRYVRPGMKLVNVCEHLEGLIRSLGGQPAFPINISINEVAAHRTALISDDEVIPSDSVVKVDIGVHVDGFIADTAVTLCFNPAYDLLIEATKEALDSALNSVKAGIRFSEVGKVIESIARRYGFRVVKNLSGHSLGRYLIHAGESIPNFYDRLNLRRFKSGAAYAIEPFLTKGFGYVKEGKLITIYSLKRTRIKGGLSSDEVKLLNVINERFKTLPFTERWLKDLGYGPSKLRELLRKLIKRGYLRGYPVLIEIASGVVAQFEDTIVIVDDNVVVTTRKL